MELRLSDRFSVELEKSIVITFCGRGFRIGKLKQISAENFREKVSAKILRISNKERKGGLNVLVYTALK
jgi:hypothetical protein